ncbi:MAG TPA: dihydroneopterin aldolase, partial [Burkholderiales bacterium]
WRRGAPELMDTIFLHEMRVDTVIGVHAWERLRPQTLELNIDIGLPGAGAGSSDAIADTIDYESVERRIREDLSQLHLTLLETLAEHVAAIILNEFGAPWVKLSVAKIGILPNVKRVGVSIERRRGGSSEVP